MDNWYWLVIGLMGIAILLAVLKISKLKKPKYHNQVKANKELATKELGLNPTPIQKVKYYDQIWKVVGETYKVVIEIPKAKITQRITREFSRNELINFEIEHLKKHIKGDEREINLIEHRLAVKTNNIFKHITLNWINWFYIGEAQILKLGNNDFYQIKSDTLRINENVRIVWRDGFLSPLKPDMISSVREDTER